MYPTSNSQTMFENRSEKTKRNHQNQSDASAGGEVWFYLLIVQKYSKWIWNNFPFTFTDCRCLCSYRTSHWLWSLLKRRCFACCLSYQKSRKEELHWWTNLKGWTVCFSSKNMFYNYYTEFINDFFYSFSYGSKQKQPYGSWETTWEGIRQRTV